MRPQELVAAAERATNAYDAAAAADLYTDDAILEVVFERSVEVHEGRAAIRAAWNRYLSAARAAGLSVEKTLVVASDDAVVACWVGHSERVSTRGLECFWVRHGAITAHLLVQGQVPTSAGGVLGAVKVPS